MAEYPSTWGTPTAQYTHGPNQDEPLARITATGAQYFHHDGLGSVVALTNNLGGTDATQRFDAWGNQIAATGTQSRYGYTGREPDETGLVFYRARYLDPTIGRFTQRDPAGMADGVNRYAYVGNNPINFTDPSGNVKKGIETGIELIIWAKSTWNKAQMEAAAAKAAALDAFAKAGMAVKTKPAPGPSASDIWSKAGKSKPSGADIDHTLDKQLSGHPTDIGNLAPLDASVNRSFGAQIAAQLRDHPIGTAVTAVSFFVSEVAKAASNVTFKDVAGFAFDLSPLGDLWDAVKIKSTGGCTSDGACSDMMPPRSVSSQQSIGAMSVGVPASPYSGSTNNSVARRK